MDNKAIKVSSLQKDIYEYLLKKSVGRDTPLESLKDFISKTLDKFEISQDDKVKIISSTLSSSVTAITTEAMRASIELAVKDSRWKDEHNLISAQIEELRASKELKNAQANKLKQEKENESERKNLIKAQVDELKANVSLQRSKTQLVCRQGDYYRTQAMIEQAKVYANIVSMAYTNDTDVAQTLWEQSNKFIQDITNYMPDKMICEDSSQ